MVTGFIILICVVIVVGLFLEIAVPRGGPLILPPPDDPPPDDPPSE